jgi:hypothetical protein
MAAGAAVAFPIIRDKTIDVSIIASTELIGSTVYFRL